MHETHLEKKLRQLGLAPDKSASPSSRHPPQQQKKVQFKLFFPRPPHTGLDYKAAKNKDGYNFVGLVLGHGGLTLQKVQRQSGCKIEIHDSLGNLNGAHPDVNSPDLHALIIADTQAKLEKGTEMLTQLLSPTNSSFKPFKVTAGGSTVLQPIPPPQGSAAPSASSADASSPTSSATSATEFSQPAYSRSPKASAAAPASAPGTSSKASSRAARKAAGKLGKAASSASGGHGREANTMISTSAASGITMPELESDDQWDATDITATCTTPKASTAGARVLLQTPGSISSDHSSPVAPPTFEQAINTPSTINDTLQQLQHSSGKLSDESSPRGWSLWNDNQELVSATQNSIAQIAQQSAMNSPAHSALATPHSYSLFAGPDAGMFPGSYGHSPFGLAEASTPHAYSIHSSCSLQDASFDGYSHSSHSHQAAAPLAACYSPMPAGYHMERSYSGTPEIYNGDGVLRGFGPGSKAAAYQQSHSQQVSPAPAARDPMLQRDWKLGTGITDSSPVLMVRGNGDASPAARASHQVQQDFINSPAAGRSKLQGGLQSMSLMPPSASMMSPSAHSAGQLGLANCSPGKGYGHLRLQVGTWPDDAQQSPVSFIQSMTPSSPFVASSDDISAPLSSRLASDSLGDSWALQQQQMQQMQVEQDQLLVCQGYMPGMMCNRAIVGDAGWQQGQEVAQVPMAQLGSGLSRIRVAPDVHRV